MIADLYICDRTFLHNGVDDNKEVCKKIVGMSEMFQEIRKHSDENNLKINKENFLNTKLLSDNSTIMEVLWGEKKQEIPRDARIILLNLIQFVADCDFSYERMICILSASHESEDNINAIVVMNEVEGIPKSNQVLYDAHGFYEFRRYYIGRYPKDPTTFLKNIVKYYDNIEFNLDKKKLEAGIKKVFDKTMDVINALSALNDYFIQEFKDKEKDDLNDINHFLKAFAKRHHINEGSTGKGEHEDLRCEFKEIGEQYCGPHLKYNYDGRGGYLRIYFCWDNNNLNKIYVGLICDHV